MPHDYPNVVLTVAIVPHDGRLILNELAIGFNPPHPEPVDITTSLLRAVSPPAIIRAVVDYLTVSEVEPTFAAFLREQHDAATREFVESLGGQRPTRRPRAWTDERLRQWASAAVQFGGDGHGRVYERLAAQFDVNAQTARAALHKARARGFLAPVSGSGRKDFQPGPRTTMKETSKS